MSEPWRDSYDSHSREQPLVAPIDRVAQAIVFGALLLFGGALIVAVAAYRVDWFYPVFAFGAAAFVAYDRFFGDNHSIAPAHEPVPDDYGH